MASFLVFQTKEVMPSARKVIATFFLRSEAVIFIDFFLQNPAVDAEYASNLAKEPFREDIR